MRVGSLAADSDWPSRLAGPRSLLPRVLRRHKPNRPLGRIGRRHELVDGLDELPELSAGVAAEGVVRQRQAFSLPRHRYQVLPFAPPPPRTANLPRHQHEAKSLDHDVLPCPHRTARQPASRPRATPLASVRCRRRRGWLPGPHRQRARPQYPRPQYQVLPFALHRSGLLIASECASLRASPHPIYPTAMFADKKLTPRWLHEPRRPAAPETNDINPRRLAS